MEFGLTVIPRNGSPQTFYRLSVRGVLGAGSGRRREFEFDDEVSREQAQASLAGLARALGMGAMLMGSLDEVLEEKRREREVIDKQIAELTAQAKVLRVEERELARACERIARVRSGAGELRRRSSTQGVVLDIFEAEPDAQFRAAELAKRIGKAPGVVATALSTLAAKGVIRSVDRGLYRLAGKAKKK